MEDWKGGRVEGWKGKDMLLEAPAGLSKLADLIPPPECVYWIKIGRMEEWKGGRERTGPPAAPAGLSKLADLIPPPECVYWIKIGRMEDWKGGRGKNGRMEDWKGGRERTGPLAAPAGLSKLADLIPTTECVYWIKIGRMEDWKDGRERTCSCWIVKTSRSNQPLDWKDGRERT